jgi:hypothetical protein
MKLGYDAGKVELILNSCPFHRARWHHFIFIGKELHVEKETMDLIVYNCGNKR